MDNRGRMEIQDINKAGIGLLQKYPTRQLFMNEIFRKTNEFLEEYNVLSSIYGNTYPGFNNTQESILFGRLCGFIICCFEDMYNLNEELEDMEGIIIDYWGEITRDNIHQKIRIEENFGSGYNLLRASSLQPVLLDYVLSENLGNVDYTIPNINNRIDFILTIHSFINILGKYYYNTGVN